MVHQFDVQFNYMPLCVTHYTHYTLKKVFQFREVDFRVCQKYRHLYSNKRKRLCLFTQSNFLPALPGSRQNYFNSNKIKIFLVTKPEAKFWIYNRQTTCITCKNISMLTEMFTLLCLTHTHNQRCFLVYFSEQFGNSFCQLWRDCYNPMQQRSGQSRGRHDYQMEICKYCYYVR